MTTILKKGTILRCINNSNWKFQREFPLKIGYNYELYEDTLLGGLTYGGAKKVYRIKNPFSNDVYGLIVERFEVLLGNTNDSDSSPDIDFFELNKEFSQI